MNDTYDAFISYSHTDKPIARHMRRGIQQIGKPFWRRRESRVFLDSSSLAASSDLKDELVEAIDASRHLIVLASPDAASSPWVDAEIEQFLGRPDGSEHVLIALTDGELEWNDAESRFDAERSTACPPALAGGFDEEPFFIDLRWLKDNDQPDRQRLRSDLSSITATVRGVPKDQLVGDDLRQQRRNLGYAGAAIAGLVVLSALAILAWLASVANAREAQSALVSTTGALRSQVRPDQGLLLARAGYAVEDTSTATRGLFETLVAAGPIDRFEDSHQSPVKAVDVTATLVATGDEDGLVMIRDLHLDVVGGPYEFGSPVQAIVVGEAGEVAVVAGADGTIRALDITTGAWEPELDLGGEARTLVGTGSLDRIWTTVDGAVIELGLDGDRVAVTNRLDLGFGRVDSSTMVGDRYLVLGGADTESAGHLVAVELDGPPGADELDPIFGNPPEWVTALAPDPADPDGVLLGAFGGLVMSWRIGEPLELIAAHAHEGLGISLVAGVEAGNRVVTGGLDGAVTMWDRGTGAVTMNTVVHGGQIWWGAPVGDSRIVTASEDTTVAMISFDEPWPAFGRTLFTGREPLSGLATTTLWDREIAVIGHGTELVWLHVDDGSEIARTPLDGFARSVVPGPGSTIASAAATAVGARFELRTVDDRRNVVAAFDVDSTGETIDFHPSEDIVIVGGARRTEHGIEGIIEFRDLDGIEVRPPITGLVANHLRSARFDSTGQSVIISGTAEDQAWLSWPDLEPRRPTHDMAASVVAVASGTGEALAVATQEQYVELLRLEGGDTEDGKLWGAQPLILAIEFDPTGSKLASGNRMGQITLWDLEPGAVQLGPPIPGHLGAEPAVTDLSFTPSGTTLLSVAKTEAMAWDLDPQSWAELICAVTDRSLLASEWDTLVGVGSRPDGSC